MEEINIMDFLSVLRRRKKLFFVTFAVTLVFAVTFALQWSNYRSTATVEVSLPEVATQSIEQETKDSPEALADLRISYLQQKVLSTGSLVEIITKYNLYQRMRLSQPMADIAAVMLGKINVELVGSESSSARSTGPARSTIAFTVSFDYSDPLLSQQVTNELVSRFLDEDIKQRQTQAKGTTAFLTAQIKSLEASLAEQEKKIAAFRSQYGETRPDELAFNQSAMTSLLVSVQNIESQISTNMGTIGALQAQLAALDPYSRIVGDGQILTTPSLQLRASRTEYATLSSKYGPEHPDVIKARHQVEALEKQVGGHDRGVTRDDLGPLRALVADTKAKLAEAEKTKGAENPDVIALQSQLAGIEKQLKDKAQQQATTALIKTDADNPAYLAVAAQIQSAVDRGRALEEQKAGLQEQLDKYQRAVVENPDAEKKMAALSRDYANAQERYRILQAKKMEAEMSETIETDRVGQRLQIINPPELPTKTRPSRKLFLLAGFAFSVMAGAAAAIGAQLFSQSVIGARHLESLVGMAPLIVVPHIVTQSERTQVTQQQIRMGGYALVGAIILAVVFSYTVMPLDVFFSMVAMRLGLY